MWFALMGVRGIYTKKMSLARVKLIFLKFFAIFSEKWGGRRGGGWVLTKSE
jgi:hypothetical protein